jgi:hypothetical protein
MGSRPGRLEQERTPLLQVSPDYANADYASPALPPLLPLLLSLA